MHAHVYRCTYTLTHTKAHINNECMHTCTCRHAHARVFRYMRVHPGTCMDTRTYIYMPAHIYTCMHIQSKQSLWAQLLLCSWVHVCTSGRASGCCVRVCAMHMVLRQGWIKAHVQRFPVRVRRLCKGSTLKKGEGIKGCPPPTG